MPMHHANLEALATKYIQGQYPDANPAAVQSAVSKLEAAISTGAIDRDAVLERLQHEIGNDRASTPTAFGNMARAVRDLDGGRLSMAERRFVSDMVGRGFGFQPSIKQNAWLRALFDRLGRRAA